MSGRFLFGTPANANDAKHDHLVLHLSGGLTVRYNDFRRFGNFAVCSSEALATHPALSRLGIDALSAELNGEVLFELLQQQENTDQNEPPQPGVDLRDREHLRLRDPLLVGHPSNQTILLAQSLGNAQTGARNP